jgi:hypothetical protein
MSLLWFLPLIFYQVSRKVCFLIFLFLPKKIFLLVVNRLYGLGLNGLLLN